MGKGIHLCYRGHEADQIGGSNESNNLVFLFSGNGLLSHDLVEKLKHSGGGAQTAIKPGIQRMRQEFHCLDRIFYTKRGAGRFFKDCRCVGKTFAQQLDFTG